MTDPFELFGLKASIVQGAGAGTLISFILAEGIWPRRILRAAGGAVFAVFGTEGFLEMAHNWISITAATERLGGLVFGIVGIYAAEGLVRVVSRLRDKSDKIADRIIKKAGS